MICRSSRIKSIASWLS